MWNTVIITMSDKGSRGERRDLSGPLIRDILEGTGSYEVKDMIILPDDAEALKAALIHYADETDTDLILTTGGTGFSPRDITPEATMSVADRNVPGIPEAMRYESLKITPKACLSRGVAVIRGEALIINLPGSPKAAGENLNAVLPALDHGLGTLTGRDTECAATSDKSL